MASISQGGWNVYTSKRPILNSTEIDLASKRLDIPLPEMIFGNNGVILEHALSQWKITFDPLDSLDLVDKHGTPDGGLVKVSYSESWLKER